MHRVVYKIRTRKVIKMQHPSVFIRRKCGIHADALILRSVVLRWWISGVSHGMPRHGAGRGSLIHLALIHLLTTVNNLIRTTFETQAVTSRDCGCLCYGVGGPCVHYGMQVRTRGDFVVTARLCKPESRVSWGAFAYRVWQQWGKLQ